ncbi:MAG: hypothetical protein EKK46_01470 [Rhodocyclaceae bacterium]|nr:MAG: hypothetical protein EKK46_01470 [Rhodocyclaceae bacterium]
MTATPYLWRFFRAGGFDQVRLDTAADLLALDQLDQKLWVALSCPTSGIEFDARTLALIDTDGDGHIRAAELIAAVQWAATRLKDNTVLARQLPGVPQAAIGDDALAEAARQQLIDLGKDGADALLTVEEAGEAETRCRARLQAAWESGGNAAQALGSDTATAHAATEAVRAKIDDYFARCRLAAFDNRAADALNADADTFRALAGGTLQAGSEAVAALPLARIDANRPLPLGESLNPAWVEPMAAFAEHAVRPLLGRRSELTLAQWNELQDKLAPYAAWLAANPADTADAAPELATARDLERLARYVRDLLPLANNFVAFRDFYTRQAKATFQVGTLYLDGRSAELCVAVSDPAKHAALAGLSRMCLVYCDCVRKGENGPEKKAIAAAFTAGDSDQLMAGRNGVFYDRQGRDWDATITRIVDHPISLRQAFWSPYKRLARLVAEQLQKVAANKAAGVESKLAEAAANAGKKIEAPKPVAQQAFDVGKFAGIFAAIGLAVGAVGTALASVVTGLLGLHWWQMPLALAGLMLAVSGPAMVVAAFKLRARNLGPLLDANGWAINTRARINIPFGTALTGLAQLPAGAFSNVGALADPYADKPFPWGRIVFLLALIGGAVFAWWKLVP